jgi:leucyl-tRNA synthetase
MQQAYPEVDSAWGLLSAEALGPGRVRDALQGEGVSGCGIDAPVEVRSAHEAGEDPKGKSRQAEPGRPAIYIE